MCTALVVVVVAVGGRNGDDDEVDDDGEIDCEEGDSFALAASYFVIAFDELE